MKINEIATPALRNHYRKRGMPEEQIDEILPALAGVAARGAAALGGMAARGIAKGVAGAAKGVARGVAGAAKSAVGAATNATQGTVGTDDDDEEMSPDEIRKARELERNIRPGATLKLPTQNNTNKPADFKIRRTVGQDVEIENPKPKPGEPKSFVFNKDELKQQLKGFK